MSVHVSDENSFVPEDDGFYVPRCQCGWSWGAVPDLDIVTDVLMEHAREQALIEDRAQSA